MPKKNVHFAPHAILAGLQAAGHAAPTLPNAERPAPPKPGRPLPSGFAAHARTPPVRVQSFANRRRGK